MIGEIICVGNELLYGNVLNTNTRFLSRHLPTLGITAAYQSVVGDVYKDLTDALTLASRRSDVIILTGGLGPTPDDMTKETVADFLSLKMEYDEGHLRQLEEYFCRLGTKMAASNKKQALCPVGAAQFENDRGTARGYGINKNGKIYIILPGPPSELEPMFLSKTAPYLKQFVNGAVVSRTLKFLGISESRLAEKLDDLIKAENPSVATYVKEGYIELVITAKAENEKQAQTLCNTACNKVFPIAGEYIFSTNGDDPQTAVVHALAEKHLKIATAESCTAGLLSSFITEVPGASEVFELGVASYSDKIKSSVLDVSKSTLKEYTAVSPQVAAQMANNVMQKAGADIGVGITGYAGYYEENPGLSGLIYIAVCDNSKTWVLKLVTGNRKGDRIRARRRACFTALDMVRRLLASNGLMEGGFSNLQSPVVLEDLPRIN